MEGTQPHQETTSNGTGDGETNSENVVSSETLDTYTNVVDEIVSVNSLFTLGVFIGLSFASRDQTSLECRPGCTAGVGSARRLVVFEVLSFSLFIYSSLVAKCANFLLSLYRDEELRIQYYLILFRKLILDYSGKRVSITIRVALKSKQDLEMFTKSKSKKRSVSE
ncbi:uncharacterized protein LOC132269206 isoform X2 [Cornus florida]|uniref:uncharacterized protein LOC132269206 isoform X2 n=1 Tax=Cornus florida TaxID=4283 RepID=UPI0028996266|nr:uncharacterized protein LOC132269206 isoform X2 [Cornus florida]